MLLVTFLLPVSTVFSTTSAVIFYILVAMAKPLTGTYGTLRFCGTPVENG